MFKKRLQLVSALLVLTASVATGCGSADNGNSVSNVNVEKGNAQATAPAGKKSTVTFWAAAVTPERDTFFQGIVKDFMAKNPDIDVNYLGVPGDLSAYQQKVNVALAAGEPPDITNDFNSDILGRGVLQPLDEYFAKWEGKDKVLPATVASVKAMDAKEGKMYALPYSQQAWAVWVRPDWFKEASLAMPDTWDQFFDSAQKLTDKAKGRYGLSLRGGAGSANTLEMLMYSYSGITDYFTKDNKATINDPANEEFVDKYLGQYNVTTPQDDLNKGWTELAATFQSGKAAMVAHNLGSASSHNTAFGGDATKYAAIPFPKSTKGYRVHPAPTPLGLTMFKNAKDKDAVWKFMTYYLSKETNSAYGKLYGEIPANTDAAKDSWVEQLPYMKMGADLLTSPETKFTANPYYLPGYTGIQKKIEPMVQMVMAKKMTAKQLLDQWAQLLEKEKSDFDAALKK